jgi:hypothetical protein
MILKGSQRGGGGQLARHLLKAENEHVEVHEIRGFMADDLTGALREAEATSKGTRCKQYLFSLSLNPPQKESARVEDFEMALNTIEQRLGLSGQPRVVVFHEKEGRRHCHAVWSRIDADKMTAIPLPFFKTKLREVSKELYLEHDWKLPRGLVDSKTRDPRNFTLEEWQQAKRIGRNAADLKGIIIECWASSDSRAAFAKALEERGMFLAKGDRRAHVALTFEGETLSIARALGKKAKDIAARIGKADDLDSVDETRQRVATDILPLLNSHVEQARARHAKEIEPLEAQRREMQARHSEERRKLDDGQRARHENETRERSSRLRGGIMGLWDRINGTYARTRQQNEIEALASLQRDREQRHALLVDQHRERQVLQDRIKAARENLAYQLRDLHRDAARFRQMQRSAPAPQKEAPKDQIKEQPRARTAFERLETLRSPPAPQAQPQSQSNQPTRAAPSPRERLERLRDKSPGRPPPEHDLEH